MARARSRAIKAIAIVALAIGLQGSTCIFCSGDGCDDDDDEHGVSHAVAVLPPLWNPLGRPLSSPMLVVIRR